MKVLTLLVATVILFATGPSSWAYHDKAPPLKTNYVDLTQDTWENLRTEINIPDAKDIAYVLVIDVQGHRFLLRNKNPKFDAPEKVVQKSIEIYTATTSSYHGSHWCYTWRDTEGYEHKNCPPH